MPGSLSWKHKLHQALTKLKPVHLVLPLVCRLLAPGLQL